MASLKRYRQTSDSNAGARFRDLPPRFKRQKSITDSNTVDTQTQRQSMKPKKMPHSDALASDNVTNSSNTDKIKDYDDSKDKKIFRKETGTRPNLTLDDRNIAKRSIQPVVLSPMDNNLFHFSPSDEQEFSTTNIVVNPFTWESQPLPNAQYTYVNDTGILQNDSLPYTGVWYQTQNGPLHQTKGSVHENVGPMGMTNAYSEIQPEPVKDYSERDQRIIEMFKELERVADQKEKEEYENGTDRKSLVSHHLRMLMCAIDKYTEGIEDDDMTAGGRLDEAPTMEERPSPSISPNNGQTSMVSSHPSQEYSRPARIITSSKESIQPTSAHNAQNCKTYQSSVITNSLHQPLPFNVSPLNGRKTSESSFKPSSAISFSAVDMQPWDLWSSPSINVLDVYSSLSKGQNSSETADSTFALFDQLGMENGFPPITRRAPLYKR